MWKIVAVSVAIRTSPIQTTTLLSHAFICCFFRRETQQLLVESKTKLFRTWLYNKGNNTPLENK